MTVFGLAAVPSPKKFVYLCLNQVFMTVAAQEFNIAQLRTAPFLKDIAQSARQFYELILNQYS